jgi:DnaJ-class molecular chaperone
MRDPYSVLGLKRNAGQEEIKAAWRSLAKAVHPDQNQDDPFATIRFTEAGRAYDLLRDPDKRSRFDRAQREAELRRMEQMRRQQADRKVRPDSTKPTDESAEDMISRIFGVDPRSPADTKPQAQPQSQTQAQATAGRQQETPADARADAQQTGVSAEPEEVPSASRGVAPAAAIISAIVRRIRGVKPKIEKAPDLVCEATVSVQDILNRARTTVELPDGQTLKIPLTAGMTEGHVIRIREQGHRIENLKRGDVVVTLRVAPGPFRTDLFNLKADLPVTIENAVLGWETTIDGPLGPIAVTVPAWSGSDQVIRVAGEGLAGPSGERGDLFLEIRLLLWEKPDDKMIDLMRSLREGLYL